SSRFWAVLIGIDGYESLLRGCVLDVLLMKKCLIEVLSVPKENIQCLLGPLEGDHLPDTTLIPTRKNIIEMICGLIHNSNILKDDIIVIYFARLACRFDCPGKYQHGGIPEGFTSLIECLVPIDTQIQTRPRDCNPSLLISGSLPISDREINSILTKLCHEKGHCITFIAD
ncbi:hypothetical protein EDD18DRAFT_1020369, partial [Armillaria luteobubalina]